MPQHRARHGALRLAAEAVQEVLDEGVVVKGVAHGLACRRALEGTVHGHHQAQVAHAIAVIYHERGVFLHRREVGRRQRVGDIRVAARDQLAPRGVGHHDALQDLGDVVAAPAAQ